jgi:hypothetical protein
MFLVRYTPDEHKQFPTVRHEYQGKLDGVLPVGKHEQDDSVLSASSVSTGIAGTVLLQSPITVQYYGPRNSLTWISNAAGVLGPSGDVDDPGGTPIAGTLAWTVSGGGGVGYSAGNVLSGSEPIHGGKYQVQVTRVSLSGSIITYSILSVIGPTSTPNYEGIAAIGGTGSGAVFAIVQGSSIPVSGTGIRIVSLEYLGQDLVLNSAILELVLTSYFHPQIIETTKSEEVVPAKYWRNTKTKTRVLMPGSTIFTTPPTGV